MKITMDQQTQRPVMTTLVVSGAVLVVLRMLGVILWSVVGEQAISDSVWVEIGLGLMSGLILASIVATAVIHYGRTISGEMTYERIASAVTTYAVSTLALLLFAAIVPDGAPHGRALDIVGVITSHLIAVGVYVISVSLAGFLTVMLLLRRHQRTRLYLMLQGALLGATWVFAVFDDVSSIFGVISVLLAVTGGVVTLMNIKRLNWLATITLDKKIRLLWLTSMGVFASIVLASMLAFNLESYVTISTEMFLRGGGVLPAALNLFGFLFFVRLFFATMASLPNSGIVDRRRSEVSALSTLTRLIAESVSVNDLLASVTQHALSVCRAHGAWAEIYENDQVQVVGAQLVSEEYVLSLHGNRQFHRLLSTGDQPVHIESTPNAFEGGESMSAIRSIIAIPLVSDARRIGTLVMFSTIEFGFEADDLKLLTAFGDTVSVGLDQARLTETAIEKERMQKEFDVARNIQQSLLPRKGPDTDCCSIDAVTIPAAQVGGDYYDYVRFANGNLGIIIADVSGKGIPAALYMATLKGVVLAQMRAANGPADLLTRINLSLFGSMERHTYITMLCAEMASDGRSLRLARAGHTPALLRLGGEMRTITPKGVAIGIVPPDRFRDLIEEVTVHTRPGDLCLLTTDGVNERRDAQLTEMTFDPLVDMMRGMSSASGTALVRETLRVVDIHGSGTDQHDDITIVGISFPDACETCPDPDRMNIVAGVTS